MPALIIWLGKPAGVLSSSRYLYALYGGFSQPPPEHPRHAIMNYSGKPVCYYPPPRPLAERAFTLLELAIALVVVSLMTGFGVQLLGATNDSHCEERTQAQIRDIRAALERFQWDHGRYPKPARAALGSNDPQFGSEATGSVSDVSSPAYGADVPGGIAQTGGVLIGALPHATLGLPVEDAADCWGNKFTYAVTNAMTSSDEANRFGEVAGGITVKHGTLAAPVTLMNDAAFVVVSHGPDKRGATPMSYGNRAAAGHCNGEAGDKIDRENCDTGNVVFFAGERNAATDTGRHYDDIVAYAAKPPMEPLPCDAQAFNWNALCSGTAPALAHGASASLGNTVAHYHGTVSVTCSNGTLIPTGGSCIANANCNAGSTSWGGNCSGSVAAVADGNSATVTNAAANYLGQVQVTCVDGVLSQAGAACTAVPLCAAQSVTWGGHCSASVGALASGGSMFVVNAASGWVGVAAVGCKDGSWMVATNFVSNCDAVVSPCQPQAVSWGNCTASTTALMQDNESVSVSNGNGAYSGTAIAVCNNGTVTASGSCQANCAAQTLSWGAGCSGSMAALSTSGSASITNSATGYTGAVTIACSNGSVTQSNASCNAVGAETCVAGP